MATDSSECSLELQVGGHTMNPSDIVFEVTKADAPELLDEADDLVG